MKIKRIFICPNCLLTSTTFYEEGATEDNEEYDICEHCNKKILKDDMIPCY